MSFELNNNDIPLEQSFKAPTSLYRGAPFWAWNGDLEKDELCRQIDVFHEMGIGGYHIHSRTGLNTEYLSDEFMELVKACRDHGKEKGMLTWLYDEDRWPSGAAGGLVTKDPEYRQCHLLFTTEPYGKGAETSGGDSSAAGRREENGELLAVFAVKLKNKYLDNYRRLTEGYKAGEGETVWYAYLERDTGSSWFNNQTYVDTLNPKAIKRFIEITHERYKEVVGDSFGKEIPAIFTDEPQFTHKRSLRFADSSQNVVLPWTRGLEAAYKNEFGESVWTHFPEVIWDLPGNRPSVWRYRYHEWIAERFAFSFADQIGNWCAENNIALTGHMMEESTLRKQTTALGDAMRSYRSMQIPGIDMLCDWEELNTAKQAQSAARQFGFPGVLSELYGVTGWHFDFKGYKRQGDWQAALGVLFRVHHLSWYCMRGEAKRDYPASISYQSPWYKEYSTIEDHFARVGAVLSRGKAVCRVGVIHPVESYWLSAGPSDTSGAEQTMREERFTNLTNWLLEGTIDFDFIAESLLKDQDDSSADKTFGVGEMQYEAVVVPGLLTIRESTLERLKKFAEAGGRIVFAGQIPSLVDSEPSDRAEKLAAKCERVAFERFTLISALEAHRDVSFTTRFAGRPSSLIYQMRQEGDANYLFVCNCSSDYENGAVSGSLAVRGGYEVDVMDTSSGTMSTAPAEYADGWTSISCELFAADHILLRLAPGRQTEAGVAAPPALTEVARLASPASVTLDEPNVLLFEKSEYAVNDGEWQPETQLLDIENVVRKEIGVPPKIGRIAQPWIDQSEVVELAKVKLRTTFDAMVEVRGAYLSLENIEESNVLFDGEAVSMVSEGYFTDKAISTIALPDFSAGRHTIEIRLSYTRKTSIEWFYLLGDFGVTIEGIRGIVTEPVRALSFGDWTVMGLPFYGGNVTYHCEAAADGSAIELPQFDATAVKVYSQGEEKMIYRPPYRADIAIRAGEPVDITLYGHRANCFGPVHLAELVSWLGPDSWRTKGRRWSPEYNVWPLGVRSAPIIYKSEDN